jgi:phosphomannomutase
MSIFKSYDIRGIYNEEWDRDTVYRIGFFLPSLLKAETILVGRDARLSSDEVFNALSEGITDSGCKVIDAGLCTTPAVYFATAFYEIPGSVMITASHNPKEYNGLKISGRNAVPVGYDTGLADLEKMIESPVSTAAGKGTIGRLDIRKDYMAHLAAFKEGIEGIKVVIDCSDGMAGLYVKDVIAGIPADIVTMYDVPDGLFPHHAPNPLDEANLEDLKKLTLEKKADLGICFDGDGDRVMFIDEKGSFISPDLIIAFLGLYFFEGSRKAELAGSAVTYDVRSSRSVVEYVRSLGGNPTICKVGHSHAKKLLRETNGIYGGELAGHYYFRENYFCDSGFIAALIVLTLLSRKNLSFSELIKRISKYHFSGEINFRVGGKDRIIQAILDEYREGELTDIDGIRMDFPSWWFSLRKSNTEPFLRLVVEAKTRSELAERTDALVRRIEELDREKPESMTTGRDL